jgi:hypothetical protein
VVKDWLQTGSKVISDGVRNLACGPLNIMDAMRKYKAYDTSVNFHTKLNCGEEEIRAEIF